MFKTFPALKWRALASHQCVCVYYIPVKRKLDLNKAFSWSYKGQRMYRLLTWEVTFMGILFWKISTRNTEDGEDNIKMHLSDGWSVDKNKLGSCPVVKLEYCEC